MAEKLKKTKRQKEDYLTSQSQKKHAKEIFNFFNISKASEPEGINARMLKETVESIAAPLTKLINI